MSEVKEVGTLGATQSLQKVMQTVEFDRYQAVNDPEHRRQLADSGVTGYRAFSRGFGQRQPHGLHTVYGAFTRCCPSPPSVS